MRRAVLLVAVVALAAPATPASAATTDVELRSSSFAPDVVSNRVGDAVRWVKTGGFHNVASTQAMFRSGDATFDQFTYSRTFSAGTYNYVCEIHGEGGMTGKVRVRPRVGSAPSGAPFTVRWANPDTNTGSAFRIQFRVGGGDWKTWRGSTTSKSGVFGADDSPVTVRSGRTYGFRARSIKGENLSGYSPVVTFTP